MTLSGEEHSVPSTVSVGNKFRDEVAGLLRAAGIRVETEILIGHKRVDLSFERVEFGKVRRYVVEAKNWQDPLNKSNLETIYGGYAAALRDGDAELIIVAPHELKSPQAKRFIADTPRVTHLSFNQFQESILGFHDYLLQFVSQHEREGHEDYFVSPLIEGGINLQEMVETWLDDPDGGPIAIIASYGMGKTTFAAHLAYKLAKRFLGGAACRIPILISLGMISREQSLEGLIGTVLAGSNPAVQGYKFPLFSHLNAAGRFVVFLDGFDEMKHMMTYSDFIANFDELNKLVVGSAKVILLGRPTAFLSDQERSSVLRGKRTVGRAKVRIPDAPQYTEIGLLPFTPPQLKTFIRSYLGMYQKKGKGDITDELIARRQIELERMTNEDLFSRPIHARMMAELASDPEFDITTLTRYELYDHFVGRLIDREVMKSGRGSLHNAHDRRSFLCELAWYLWTEPLAVSLACRIDELPDWLFELYIPVGEEIGSVKRDLLSASFLDEKKGGVFYFSHRSFQEFLVAEFIWSRLTLSTDLSPEFVANVIGALTKEVFDFLIERGEDTVFQALFGSLAKLKHGIPVERLRTLASSKTMRDLASQRSGANFSVWDAAILISTLIPADGSINSKDLVKLAKTISRKAKRKPTVLLASMNAILGLGAEAGVNGKELAPAIIVILFTRIADIEALSKPSAGRKRGDALRDAIFESVSAELIEGSLSITLSLEALQQNLRDATNLPIWRRPGTFMETREFRADFDKFFAEFPAGERKILDGFYERDAKFVKLQSSSE